jgi:hypothetical protein
MKNSFKIYFLLLLPLSFFSQTKEKYKVTKIDTAILQKYFMIEIIDSKGEVKKLFSDKTHITAAGEKIKPKNKYYFLLQAFDFVFDKKSTVILRSPHSTYVDSIKILDIHEKAYQTPCLNGIIYVDCK